MSGAWASADEEGLIPRAPAPPGGPPGRRISLTPEDFLSLFWRQRWLMVAVFMVIFILGAGAAMTMKKTYSAQSSLLVRLGQEYVYNPQVGDAARGTAPEGDQVVQAEAEILGSAALKERVIRKIGLARLYPDLGKAYAKASPDARKAVEGSAIRLMEGGLKIGTTPGSSVVKLAFTHTDPNMAAEVLNVLVDEYKRYRGTVLAERDSTALAGQRRIFQQRLDKADAAFQKFLAENNIGDFDSEKASLAAVYGALLSERYSLTAQASEVAGRLGATRSAVAAVPPEIGLYQDVDQTAQAKLNALRLERQDLMSRYRPDSQPVREIDQKIAQVGALAAGAPPSASGKRIGVNPVYQTLQTEKSQLEAQAASVRSRQAAINQELAQIMARRQELTELEPRYQALARERDLLATNVRNFAAREQESQAAQALAQSSSDNVRVVERAYAPTKGKSMKKIVLVLALLFAGFTAVCVGLLRAFLTRGLPTAAAAERALELPVLATAPLKQGYAS
jgi:uncharacterized protein involved in exopolysaccharide biosynthesis